MHKFRGRDNTKKDHKIKNTKNMSFIYKQKSKNMCFCYIDQFPGSICFVFDCVTHEDNYSCPEICTCLSYYAYWNDWTQTVLSQPN